MQSSSSTSSFEPIAGTRRLWLRLTWFVLPSLVLLGVPACLMLAAGEFATIRHVVDLQATSAAPVYFGRAYSDPTARYKFVSVVERRPELLVLGTSRVLAIRSAAFKADSRFFNAGNGVTRLRHYRAFVQRIPAGQEPRLLLLGLDQYFFNARFDKLAADGFEAQWEQDPEPTGIFFGSWKRVYGDYFSGKFGLPDLVDTPGQTRIGLNARVQLNAFRKDGSYTWASYVADPANPRHEDHGFRNTLDRIAKGNRRFEYGEQVSDAALQEVDALLRDCKARGIHVVAFLPPFAHTVLRSMRERSADYGYLAGIMPGLRPIFLRHGFVLEDYSDLAGLGATDRETIDGFHGSEKAYLRLLLRLSESDALLRASMRDPAWLQDRLRAAAGDQLVFTHEEP
jgi:hypothetical protein